MSTSQVQVLSINVIIFKCGDFHFVIMITAVISNTIEYNVRSNIRSNTCDVRNRLGSNV